MDFTCGATTRAGPCISEVIVQSSPAIDIPGEIDACAHCPQTLLLLFFLVSPPLWLSHAVHQQTFYFGISVLLIFFLLLLLLLQVFLYLYRSCQVSVVLLALAQEPEILVKSFSEHSPLTLA